MPPRIPLDPHSCRDIVGSQFWSDRVTPAPGDCMLWTGSRTDKGYPYLTIGRQRVAAHRVALVAHLGRDILPGMEAGHADHDAAYAAGLCLPTPGAVCEHRRCVNAPAGHVVEQDRRTNTLASGSPAAVNARMIVCERCGAAFDPLTWSPGHRRCEACHRAASAEQADAIGAAARAMGLMVRQYTARHGWSTATALAILADPIPGQMSILDLPGVMPT